MFVQFPEVNRLAMAEYESLNEEDRQRRFWLTVSFWHGMQGLYRQKKLGTLPETEWDVWVRVICANYERSDPQLWERAAATHSSDFVEFVENCELGYADLLPE